MALGPNKRFSLNTGSQADTRQVTTVVHRLDLAVDASLTKAWTFPATDTIRESTTVLWQRNGLRIGVLAPAARAAFRETLGPVHGEHRRLVVGTRIPVKLAASTGALAPLTLVLAESDDTAQETTIAGGVVQLLLRVHALDTGQSFVELTPQHHQPRRTYFQDPRERTAAPTTPGHLPLPSDLIGTPFRPLIATVGLGPGEALVVGPILRSGGKTPATPTPEEEATDDDTKIEVQDDATDADEETSDPDHSPRRLGHVLMTGRRMTRAVQSIYLIERPSR